MSGLKLTVLYGFYPNKLGFCGTQEDSAKKALFNYLSGKKVPEQKIRKILETFKGVFFYYKLIAKSNGIKNPFDEKVVKAYWVGNQLLEKVPITSLKEMIVKEFPNKQDKKIPFVSKAHHSFHVFVIGSVTGRIKLEGKLLDLCRIGWGKVIGYKKEEQGERGIIVEYQPIKKTGKGYFLGKPVHKFVFWDKKFVPKIEIGDNVAIHWNHIVRVLNKRDLDNLKKYTQITIDSL